MMYDRDIEDHVVATINKEIGNDCKKLHRASILVKRYTDRLSELHKKLDFSSRESDSSFIAALDTSKHACKSVSFHLDKILYVGEQISGKLRESKKLLMGVDFDLKMFRKLDQLLSYLKIIQAIAEINSILTNAISGRDDTKSINTYLKLYESNDKEHSIIGQLKLLDSPHLKLYAEKTTLYWYKLLRLKLSKNFEDELALLRWGTKEEKALLNDNSTETAKVQILAEYLFLVKNPQGETEQYKNITPSIICPSLSIVSEFLLAPFRKRFFYHFTGNRQTNRLDKPEWFYTQILNWGRETHLCVGKIFQPAADRAGLINLNIRLEFLRGLVQLAIEKLVSDIEEISCNEILFAHLLDETFAFECELREVFGYPSSFPSAISVITQPTYLQKWISLEERFCAEKMDYILQDNEAWSFINPHTYDDTLKIPKCADQFVRLLEAVKDRYCSLIQPGHQLQFLTLQLELIDSFRMRLVQLHSNGLVESVPILNAINYITMVLREWGENVHYLHLHAVFIGPNADEYNSVFENSINELEHWSVLLLKSLANKVVNEVKAKSMIYRRDSWSNMSEELIKEPLMLSQSAGEMLQVLVTTLYNLENGLSANHFSIVLRLIAKQFDAYMFDSMILNTKFSTAGAAQFDFDLKRNFFPVFGQYSKRPDLLLKRLHDSNILLNCGKGAALLILDALENLTTMDDKIKILRDVGVIYLKSHQCIDVLERRSDIKNI